MSRMIKQDLTHAFIALEQTKSLAGFGFTEASRRRGRAKVAFWQARIAELKAAQAAAKEAA